VSVQIAPAAHLLGVKTLKALIQQGEQLKYVRARLNSALFVGEEQAVFDWVAGFMAKYAKLPTLETLTPHFPIIAELSAPEAAGYYLDLLQNRFEYNTINQANLDAQAILKTDKTQTAKAREVLRSAVGACIAQAHRMQLTDFGKEGKELLTAAYKQTLVGADYSGIFGWPTLDYQTQGIMPGDLVSFVGRPATGKSWLALYLALANWLQKHRRVLLCSMEMNTLAICLRIAAMYAGLPAAQIKKAALSTGTFESYFISLDGLSSEEGGLWVLDGNLAACPEDIYELAHTLGCDGVVIDGAYLTRHRNKKLDRYTRVAENAETMKACSGDLGMWTAASWQLKREAAAKTKKHKGKPQGEKADLEDIGYSDAIGQLSSIVIGLMQEESVETINGRWLEILKGRNGETGKLHIKWDFQTTDFSEFPKPEKKEDAGKDEAQPEIAPATI
jgi:replicative DNA helicase